MRKKQENQVYAEVEQPIVQQNRMVVPSMVRVRARFPIAETRVDGSVGRYGVGDEFEVTRERAAAIAPSVEIIS